MRTLIKKYFSLPGSGIAFFVRNLWCGQRIKTFPSARFGRFAVESFRWEYSAEVEGIYAALTGGKRLGVQTKAILRVIGSRLCMIARDEEKKEVVGVLIFYFNARDRREGTVHEAYIGLREPVRGAGLGSFMRRHALAHFARLGLAGASSRISVDNLPSLKANQKLGFIPVETYFDNARKEERHYLVCNLSRYRDGTNKPMGN